MKIAAIILAIASAAWAGMPWRLTSADLITRNVELRAVNQGGIDYLDNDGHVQHLPLGQFVQAQRELPARNAENEFMLALSDGERWAGFAVGMNGEQLAWRNPLLGSAAIPLARIAEMVRGGNSFVPAANPTEDVVHLINGDIVHGAITAMSPDRVIIQTANVLATIPWSNIATVQFASLASGASPTTRPEGNWRITLDDGSVLRAEVFTWGGHKVEFTANGQKHDLPASHLVSISQLNGPVYFLASATPIEDVQIPLFGPPSPAQFGEDLSGNPLPNAISVHAYSKLVWIIPAGFRTLHLQYAIPPDLSFANVMIHVGIDGRMALEKAGLLAGTNARIDLPLNGGHRLTLEVDTASPYRTQGWLTWISPALIK